MKTEELLEKLGRRYQKPTWVFLPNVRSTTGYASAIRTADAIAMGMYPSRGLHLHGHELKISRSDWLRELKEPEKAEEIARYCDYWWLVVSEEGIVLPGELPTAWGLMIANGRGGSLKVVKEAQQNTDASVPPHFLASLLRSATEGMIPEAMIESRIQEAEESGKSSRDWEVSNAKREKERMEESLEEFEKASGIQINSWDSKRIGSAVRVVLDAMASRDRLLRNLREHHDAAMDLAKDVARAVNTLEKLDRE